MKRAEYRARIRRVRRSKRVYVDESGVHTWLRREYARAPRGKPVEEPRRGKRFDRINIIGAPRDGKPIAVERYRHPTDGAFFERWFAKRPLREPPKGYTIIMDNAGFHSKTRLRKLARGKARPLFPPPYSPDYNPIEQTWANMKRFLGNNPRDYQSVDSAVCDYFHIPDS